MYGIYIIIYLFLINAMIFAVVVAFKPIKSQLLTIYICMQQTKIYIKRL